MSSSTSFGSGTFGTSDLGTTPFFNVKSLIDDILSSTGHTNPASETTKRRAILQYINNVYQFVCLGRDWPWIRAAYDFRLLAPYDTGQATATQGSDLLAGTGTVWSSNLSPKNVFWFNNSSVVYHVLQVNSNTELQFETAFSEDTETDGSYTIGKNQYQLPKETDYLQTFIVSGNGCQFKMIPLSPDEFRLQQSKNPTAVGQPKFYSLIRRDTDDDRVYVEVYPTPDKFYQCHILYKVRILYLEDLSTCYPIIPDRYRSVLFFGALEQFYLYLRQPDQSAKAGQMYQSFLLRMENDYKPADGSMRIEPARNYLRRRPQLWNRNFIDPNSVQDVDE